jgi:hypothetical protein
MRFLANVCILSFFLLANTLVAGDSPNPPRVVTEHFDQLWVVHEREADGEHKMTRIYFLRDGEIQAERASHDEMHLSATGNGQFVLCWDDYGVCQRVVTADSLVEFPGVLTDDAMKQPGWWARGKRLPNLQQPVRR